MQTIRCKNCGKVLMEIEGNAHIRKKCPKCKNMNDFYIEDKQDTDKKE